MKCGGTGYGPAAGQRWPRGVKILSKTGAKSRTKVCQDRKLGETLKETRGIIYKLEKKSCKILTVGRYLDLQLFDIRPKNIANRPKSQI